VINFLIVACRISSRLKWYKNYKNRLRLAKVIVKNQMSRFFMVQCVVVAKLMTLNCIMTVILRFFTEFGRFGGNYFTVMLNPHCL